MGTIASLLGMLGDTQPRPWDVAQRSVTEADTGLIKLADLKRQQAAEAAMMERIKNDPAVAQQIFGGGPVLGSLMQPQGQAGPGPLTQQTVMPGQAPGVPQTVPGGQDLSQFATQGGPPQSTIASLGPAGQAQMQPQAPRNPILEMAAKDPRAAMMLQDQQIKAFTTQLTLREKTAEAVASALQGVNSQDSYEPVRQDIARFAPQIAARLPQQWSKEAVQPFIDAAIGAKDKATLDINKVSAAAELQKARMSGRVATTDEYLKALGVTPGTEQPEDMQRALELKNRHLAEIQAANVTPQLIQGQGGGYWAVNPRTLEKRPVPGEGSAPVGGGGAAQSGSGPQGDQLRAPMTAEDKKQAGYINRAQEGNKQLETLEAGGDYTAWTAAAQNLPGGRLLLSDKQKQYETAKGVFLQGILRRDSAGQITKQEWDDYGRIYFPVPGDGPKDVEQKRILRQQYLQSEQATLGRPSGQQQSGTQAQPTSQGSTGGGGQTSQSSAKPVGQMSREEIAAEIAALKKKGGS